MSLVIVFSYFPLTFGILSPFQRLSGLEFCILTKLIGQLISHDCAVGASRCSTKTSKGKCNSLLYFSCEPSMNQHSLLNCTRDTPRGRDIYTALIVQHDVRDPFFKDYIIGQNYYFICECLLNISTVLESIVFLSWNYYYDL